MFTDPILKQLIGKYPPPQFVDKSEQLFESLIESIISQQLSVKVADIIFARFLKLFEPKPFPDRSTASWYLWRSLENTPL